MKPMRPRLARGFLVVAVLFVLGAVASLSAQDIEPLRPGLRVTLTDGQRHVTTILPRPVWYLQANQSHHHTVKPNFTAQWQGLLTVIEAGEHQFDAPAAALSIDGQRIGEQPVALSAGLHEFLLSYERTPGAAKLVTRWRSETFDWEPIPSRVFQHRATQSLTTIDQQREMGRWLVEELGCARCHDAGDTIFHNRAKLDLTTVASRVKRAWLHDWIENPRDHKPHAAMPTLPMRREGDAQAIAQFLNELATTRKREYAEKADNLANAREGEILFRSKGCVACHDQPDASLAGISRKWLPSALVSYLLDPNELTGTHRMPRLGLTIQESSNIAAFLLASDADHARPENAKDEESAPNIERVSQDRGRDAIERLGCVACHVIQSDPPIENRLTGPPLVGLDTSGGCLSQDPPLSVPHFALTHGDREAIALFIDSLEQQPLHDAPIATLYRDAKRYGCVHCHQVDHLTRTVSIAGNTEAAPSLEAVGEKLQPAWITQVIAQGERTRNHLQLRMPAWPQPVADRLTQQLVAASGHARTRAINDPVFNDEQREHGVALLGNSAAIGGLGCIGCHDWGDYRAMGEGGPQLVGLTDRLRFDWFDRWMRQPNRIRPGTSMPLFFTQTPPQETTRTIHSLWAALAKGDDAPTPHGAGIAAFVLGSEDAPLPLRSRPVVLRTFMPRATPASFAVGMPAVNAGLAPVSYCFDAGTCQLRYAWSGGFIDMRPTTTKSMDLPVLLGEVFWERNDGPWRIAETNEVPTLRFRGYRLREGYPEFHYEVDGAQVFETITPSTDRTGLVRAFRVVGVRHSLRFIVNDADGESSETTRINTTPPMDNEGALIISPGEATRFEVRILSREAY